LAIHQVGKPTSDSRLVERARKDSMVAIDVLLWGTSLFCRSGNFIAAASLDRLY
jgi:hypothetical protein